ncbi:hypothetical protein BY458DRAFT_539357 [Sporodiniella umbellata]|nr:hypothetical protein BY458DRAFT_539357 [Sporodiniella umbellata]
MMCDTNWCTFCDNAISHYSDSLYCSEECLKQDALRHHPLLGYDYAELDGFPHSTNDKNAKRKSTCSLHSIQSTSPSLSSSISSIASHHDSFPSLPFFRPKPRRVTPIHFTEQMNQAVLRA